jgi:hypothetical protein
MFLLSSISLTCGVVFVWCDMDISCCSFLYFISFFLYISNQQTYIRNQTEEYFFRIYLKFGGDLFSFLADLLDILSQKVFLFLNFRQVKNLLTSFL